MTDAAGSLEARLAVLEGEVARLRDEVTRDRATTTAAQIDAEAARVLSAGADHDVTEVRAELRAHTRVLGALRETQLEHQAETRQGFAKVNTGIATIMALLERIAGDTPDEP